MLPHLAAVTVVLLALGAGLAPSAFADDRGTLIEVRAERLANAGECADAVALLSAAPEPARSSAELLRLKGKCEIELARYAAAVDSLNASKAANPALANVDLMLGIAHYHNEALDSAGLALDAARTGSTDRQAELELYSGLIALQAGRSREAALALERARRLDADAVEPVASYYAALAWHSEHEDDRARAALERTRQNDPDGPWAKQASDALRTVGGDVPWWLVIGAGVEYDSNAILRATGDTQRDSDDFRAVWSVSGGDRLLETENWSGGIIGSYSGSGHFDHTDFDLHYPSAGAWLDRRLGTDALLRFRYDFGYAWLDSDPFLATHRGQVSLFYDWGVAGTTDLFVEGMYNDYKYDVLDWPDASSAACGVLLLQCGPDGLNESRYRDRDGKELSVGVEQRVPIAASSTTVRGGYRFRRYWADGDEWDLDGHRFHVGLSSLLPFDVLLDVEGSYTYAPFRNATSYPNAPAPALVLGTYASGDRTDQLWVVAGSLEKAITDDVSVAARYRYTDSISNSDFFDYHRHVVGAYVTVRLP